MYNIKKLITDNFGTFYNVTIFNLKRFDEKSYYIKEHLDNNKVEFKQIPRKFLMQCIKKYENKEIIDIDRKFLDEGYVATYDSSIFDK